MPTMWPFSKRNPPIRFDRKTCLRSSLCALVAVALPVSAEAGTCERQSSDEICKSREPDEVKLCKIARQGQDGLHFTFVRLDTSFFLVAGLGFSQVNLRAGTGMPWYTSGDVTLGGAKPGPHDRCLIAAYSSLLRRGELSFDGTIAMVRTTPFSGTPYLLDIGLGGLSLQEARSLMCSGPDSKSIRLCRDDRTFEKAWRGSGQGYRGAADLLKADKAALSPQGRANSPHLLYEQAGILTILDERPKDLSSGQYVSMLNNYAHFATRTERVEVAVEILWKVLRLAPRRVPAYLNMADAIDALVADRKHTMPLDESRLAALRTASTAYRRAHTERKQAQETAAPAATLEPYVEAMVTQFRQKVEPRLAQIERLVEKTRKQLAARGGGEAADTIVDGFSKAHASHVGELGKILESQQPSWQGLDGEAIATLTPALDKAVKDAGAQVVESFNGWPTVESAEHGLIAQRFGPWLSPAMKEFLDKVTVLAGSGWVAEASLLITWDELAERLADSERFQSGHPGFVWNERVRSTSEAYRKVYFTGPDDPPFDGETKEILPEVRKSYETFAARHKDTESGRMLGDYVKVLKKNGWKRGRAVVKFLRDRKLLDADGNWPDSDD